MPPEPPDREQVRQLAEHAGEGPTVLSLYLDLNAREFATPPARATAVHSLLDDAERKLDARDGLSHEQRVGLKGALERARDYMEGALPADGAQGLALFVSGAGDLFEAIPLPRPVRSRAALERSPLVGPLAAAARSEGWAVVLVNRQDARLFRGSTDGLREIARVHDDVHGRHEQGGLSQARYQRSVDKEATDHLKNAAERLFRHFRRRPFDHLLVGGPTEAVAEFEGLLHDWLRERLAGRLEIDVSEATPEAVLEAARASFEEAEERREGDALARLDEGSRAVAGLEATLGALNERRAELLLLDEGFSAGGTLCGRCGWVGPASGSSCPADGSELIELEDVGEQAVELALAQDADILYPRTLAGELRERGGIAALTRF